MKRIIAATLLTLATTAVPVQPAAAQGGLDGLLLGGAAGAIIGAAMGAAIAGSMEPRRSGYYWYQGDCWLRRGDGSYMRVSVRYCD